MFSLNSSTWLGFSNIIILKLSVFVCLFVVVVVCLFCFVFSASLIPESYFGSFQDDLFTKVEVLQNKPIVLFTHSLIMQAYLSRPHPAKTTVVPISLQLCISRPYFRLRYVFFHLQVARSNISS